MTTLWRRARRLHGDSLDDVHWLVSVRAVPDNRGQRPIRGRTTCPGDACDTWGAWGVGGALDASNVGYVCDVRHACEL